MRIAFDLDDTLIPTTGPFAVGAQRLGLPFRWFFPECLRDGAADLLRALAEHHELWIYTTSLRKSWHVKAWLRCWGVPVSQVVTGDMRRRIPDAHAAFSKATAYFSIDLMVDDALGVFQECEAQGVSCVIVRSDDLDWRARIEEAVRERLSSMPRHSD